MRATTKPLWPSQEEQHLESCSSSQFASPSPSSANAARQSTWWRRTSTTRTPTTTLSPMLSSRWVTTTTTTLPIIMRLAVLWQETTILSMVANGLQLRSKYTFKILFFSEVVSSLKLWYSNHPSFSGVQYDSDGELDHRTEHPPDDGHRPRLRPQRPDPLHHCVRGQDQVVR